MCLCGCVKMVRQLERFERFSSWRLMWVGYGSSSSLTLGGLVAYGCFYSLVGLSFYLLYLLAGCNRCTMNVLIVRLMWCLNMGQISFNSFNDWNGIPRMMCEWYIYSYILIYHTNPNLSYVSWHFIYIYNIRELFFRRVWCIYLSLIDGWGDGDCMWVKCLNDKTHRLQ